MEILEELKRYSKESFCNDIKTLSIADRNLQVCTELIIDMSSYIPSKLNVEIPETYKEIVRKIKDVGIIDELLEQKLQEIVGLRKTLFTCTLM